MEGIFVKILEKPLILWYKYLYVANDLPHLPIIWLNSFMQQKILGTNEDFTPPKKRNYICKENFISQHVAFTRISSLKITPQAKGATLFCI